MKLIDPSKLALHPESERIPGTSLARTRARALRAWRRGEGGVTVTHENKTVGPDAVDWSKLPRESASPGGRNARPPRSVRLSIDRETRLSRLASAWGVSENEAVGRAIDEAFSSKIGEL
jgi:hypothetical protein